MQEFPLNGSVKKLRILTFALIASGALNIGLVVKDVVDRVQSTDGSPQIRSIAAENTHFEMTLSRYFADMEKRSFHELVSCLTNRDPVEEGYLKRDLALSALALFHHFHLEKALGSGPCQKREVTFQDGKTIVLFPGLSEQQFGAIIRFAYEEKWPLTTEGLFKLLQKLPVSQNPSLVQAFCVTPEFHALYALFQKTESGQTQDDLVQLISEGSWNLFATFAKGQAQVLDFSIERRRDLLLQYIAEGSLKGAQMILATDLPFVEKRLGDNGILTLLSLCDPKSEVVHKLCVDLLGSPRSDAVLTAAASFLYRSAGEDVPSSLDLSIAKSRFAKSVVKETSPRVETVIPSFREHVVKEGESLWKISRQYGVSVDKIVQSNEMDKDRLYPGMILRIP
jgi:hypothetical protein